MIMRQLFRFLYPIAKIMRFFPLNPVISGNINKLTFSLFCSMIIRIKWIIMSCCAYFVKKQDNPRK